MCRAVAVCGGLVPGRLLAVAAAGAAAQPQTNRPGLAAVCVDANGELRAPLCRHLDASRLDAREDICLCPRGQKVEADVCPAGVAGPPDSLAVNRARNEFLRQHSTLAGATWQGRPLCVVPGRLG